MQSTRFSRERHFAGRERIYRNSRRNSREEKGREARTKDLWFPRGVPARRRSYRGTAVHYFLMSNKAISMCPDQGPQVLTRVISPGSPACATSSSERQTLLSSPFSATFRPVAPHAGRWRDHVTTPAPPETRDARCYRRARAQIDEKKMAARYKGEGEDWGGGGRKIKGGGDDRRSCPP